MSKPKPQSQRKNNQPITKKNPRAAGKPEIEISPDDVENFAAFGATHAEIANFYGADRSTITKRLKDPDLQDAWLKGKARMHMSLRRAQYKSAVELNNVTAQIWLGKQELDQKDTQYLAGDAENPIEFANAEKTIKDRHAAIARRVSSAKSEGSD